MKPAVLVSLLASAMSASAVTQDYKEDKATPYANDYLENGCADIVVIYARGSLQVGNLGLRPGLKFANAIRAAYPDGKVAVQGLNYKAGVLGTFRKKGTDEYSLNMMEALITDVATKCTDSKIVLAGFNQGASVIHGVGKKMPAEILARVNAVVTFGDPRNYVDEGKIFGIPPEKVHIICHIHDTRCLRGRLWITHNHLKYGEHVAEAVEFIEQRLNKA